MKEELYKLVKEKFQYRNLPDETIENITSGLITIMDDEPNLSLNEKLEVMLNAINTFTSIDQSVNFNENSK